MGLRRPFFRFYWTVEKLIVPGLKYSQAIYEEVLLQHSNGIDRWLDLGCGHHILPPWRVDQERSLVRRPNLIVGLDYHHDSLKKHRSIEHRVRGTISSMPFGNESFDLVTANMVFEHVSEPDIQFSEILRVLKPGGLLLFHTPNAKGYVTAVARRVPEFMKAKLIWILERRKEEDAFPAYYRVNSTRDIDRIARSSGFEIVSLRLIPTKAALVMIPPLAIIELFLIRLLMTKVGEPFRTNILAILKKPNDGGGPGHSAPVGTYMLETVSTSGNHCLVNRKILNR